MFTGIVETVGEVLTVQNGHQSCRLTIRSPEVISDLAVGSSIAVDGVCLTIVEVLGDRFSVDVGPETLRCTTLGSVSGGGEINLERPLRLDQRLGGHLVQGHVDGVGTVTQIMPEGDTRWMEIAIPDALRAYVVEKGSVAIDGVSLTVARVTTDGFVVSLIPHTLAVTTLGTKRGGDQVNVEVDIVAKYVERLLTAHLEAMRGRTDVRTVQVD